MNWDTATVRNQTTPATTAGGQTHTVGNGFNRCLWVAVFNGGTSITVSGTPTFAGQNLTLLSGMPHNGTPIFSNFYLYRLIAPPSGSGVLAMTFGASTTATIVILSASGVNQTTPNDTVDTDTSFEDAGDSTAITASASGDEVVDFLVTGGVSAGGNFIEGGGQTELAQNFNATEAHAVAVSRKAGATSVTMTWDIFGAIGDITSGYHLQMNVNSDGFTHVTYGSNTGDEGDTEDAHLRLASPTQNYQDVEANEVTKYLDGDHANTIIRFTGLDIPEGSTIEMAVVRFRLAANNAVDNNFAISAFRLLRNWVIAQVTWNVFSTGNSWTTGGADGSGTDRSASASDVNTIGTAVAVGTLIDWDVTADIDAFVNDAVQNNGWIFIRTDGGGNDEDYRVFDSEDSLTDGFKPQLIVLYTPPPPPPAPTQRWLQPRIGVRPR